MSVDNSLDFIELSSCTYKYLTFAHKHKSTKKHEAFSLEFAEKITLTLSKTRTYVTRGFKTVPAMTDALNIVDGVRLARSVCLEPELPRQILTGEVYTAINQLTDDIDLGITSMTAGTQIRQLGKGHELIELSEEKNLEAFKKDTEAWAKSLAEDKEKKKYGFVDVESVKAVPYRSPARTLYNMG